MLKIWTDGGCFPNPGPGGWGYVRSDGFEECGGDTQTTNNRMEMMGIIKALSKLPDGEVVTVYSDSQYCVKGLTVWHAGWKKKNWMKKGEPMLNRDLWLELHDHTSRLQASFEWVRGHNGDQMNERADALASMGARQNGVIISTAKVVPFASKLPEKSKHNDFLSIIDECNAALDRVEAIHADCAEKIKRMREIIGVLNKQ